MSYQFCSGISTKAVISTVAVIVVTLLYLSTIFTKLVQSLDIDLETLGSSESVFDVTNFEDGFAVCMTTIPVRFPYLLPTLASLLSQTIRPVKIFIFIPNKYRRFRRKKNFANSISSEITNSDYLRELLHRASSNNDSIIVRNGIQSNVIKVVGVDKDYGPATRFIGLLNAAHMYNQTEKSVDSNAAKVFAPKYWVVCDDDVRYTSRLFEKYLQHINYIQSGTGSERHIGSNSYSKKLHGQFALTHFAAESRITFQLGDNVAHKVPHLQGVDTYLIPNSVLQHHLELSSSPLFLSNVHYIFDYFHSRCSASFYQDDYLVSLVIALSSVELFSTYNNDVSYEEIEGISKTNSQMHTNEEVFIREEIVKQCIANEVKNIKSILNSNKQILDLSISN